jgi:hypothetical protein
MLFPFDGLFGVQLSLIFVVVVGGIVGIIFEVILCFIYYRLLFKIKNSKELFIKVSVFCFAALAGIAVVQPVLVLGWIHVKEEVQWAQKYDNGVMDNWRVPLGGSYEATTHDSTSSGWVLIPSCTDMGYIDQLNVDGDIILAEYEGDYIHVDIKDEKCHHSEDEKSFLADFEKAHGHPPP